MEYPYFWFIASAILFLMEAMGVSGIGLFFAAFGALSTGMLVQAGILPEQDYLAQTATFFGLTAFWAAVLWKPLKKLRLSKSAQPHHDMVGRIAVVADEGLAKGRTGHAHWSGTTMRARLAEDAAEDIVAGGQEMKIVAVDGSTLILAQKDYLLATCP